MNAEQNIRTINQKIQKHPQSWKLKCRQNHCLQLQKRKQLMLLKQEIKQTEEFIAKAWALIFSKLYKEQS